MAALTMHDIWERAERGPIIPEAQFDKKVVFPTMKKIIKKYDIKYDPEQVVPNDDGLADRIWEAAMEYITEVGMLCVDTEKVIQFTRDELEETLDTASGLAVVGEGMEKVDWVHRSVEDSRPPIVTGGAVCCPGSRDINLKVAESYGREPACDIYWPPTLIHGTMGLEPTPGSPVEVQTEMEYCLEAHEGLRRGGRPGTPIMGSNLISAVAMISSLREKYYRKSDVMIVIFEVQMKVNYDKLCLALACRDYGMHYAGIGTGFVGGFFGGPEGASVGIVAETILGHVVCGGDIVGHWSPDLMKSPGCAARKPTWVAATSMQALARNSKLVWWACAPYAAYAGAGTDMYMQEVAASCLAQAVSGAPDLQHGGGGLGIALDSFGGGIESRFVKDVGIASTRMDRAEANEIVKKLLSKYEHHIDAKSWPEGKTFQELNDMDTLKPTAEFKAFIDKTYEEMGKLGLDLSNPRA